jgi:hypothetical protein
MAQNCLACFAAFVAPLSAGTRFAGFRYCTRNAPLAQSTNPDAWIWPKVEDDWTCREGADAITGQSYSVIVNGQPGTGGAGPGYLATSTTSATIGAGAQALSTQLNLAYTAGARVRASSTGSGAWMEGPCTGYDASGLLSFTADATSGSGTHTDWDINLAGQPGSGVSAKGTFTLNAAPTTTVVDAAVAADSDIPLTAINAPAAQTSALIGLYISARVAGASFDVSTSDGSPALGTETFSYSIIN